MFLRILFLFFIFTFSRDSYSVECPNFDDGSYFTKNNNGRSSYVDLTSRDLMKAFIKASHYDIKKPILDVGAGYGGATYQFLNLGAKEIYVNDLDSNNLACMKLYLNNSKFGDTSSLKYISGSISNQKIYNKLPENHFGLVYAKNVIQFMSAEEVIVFFNVTYKLLSDKGYLFIIFENPLLKNEMEMINRIYKKYDYIKKSGKPVNIDKIVQNEYKNTYFNVARSHCSFETYKSTPQYLRTPGFPCQLNSGQLHALLLPPNIINFIATKSGYKLISYDYYQKFEGTSVMIFQKGENQSN